MRRKQSDPKRSKIDMTPMIDVVFNLLAFFIMTFKIIVPEGDFNIKMPPMGSAQESVVLEPFRITLSATSDGEVREITFGGNPPLGGGGPQFKLLRDEVSRQVWIRGGPDKADVEIELKPDPHLRWEFVIEAVTAVTGRKEDGRIERICDKVKFAPRTNVQTSD